VAVEDDTKHFIYSIVPEAVEKQSGTVRGCERTAAAGEGAE
jgi:hypothetical protein